MLIYVDLSILQVSICKSVIEWTNLNSKNDSNSIYKTQIDKTKNQRKFSPKNVLIFAFFRLLRDNVFQMALTVNIESVVKPATELFKSWMESGIRVPPNLRDVVYAAGIKNCIPVIHVPLVSPLQRFLHFLFYTLLLFNSRDKIRRWKRMESLLEYIQKNSDTKRAKDPP